MFTGIVEAIGRVVSVKTSGSNKRFEIHCPFVAELKIDQSLSHNGVCLTVVDIKSETYVVEAIQETLSRSSLGRLQQDSLVNLERCLLPSSRLDGHFVLGHVDSVGDVLGIRDLKGSWIFEIGFADRYAKLVIEKGSITVDGISLTVVEAKASSFTVAIIPYTFDHTNMKCLKVGDIVNLEFDVIGKYVDRIMSFR